MPAKVNYERCCWREGKPTCSCSCCAEGKGCIAVCPVEAIKRADKVVIDPKKCIRCGVCLEVCPNKAIYLE